MESSPPTTAVPAPIGRMIPGKYIVLALLALGVTSSAVMWTYWKLHLAPFLPLQRAIFAQYPKSLPRVEGGRNKRGPMTLRIVFQAAFLPVRDDPRTQATLESLCQLARQHHDLAPYELLEIFLVWREPERPAHRLRVLYKVPDLASGSPQPEYTFE